MPYYQVSVNLSEGLEPNQVTLTLKTTDAKTDAQVTSCCDVTVEFPGFDPESQPTYAMTLDGVTLIGGCETSFLEDLHAAVADMFSEAEAFNSTLCTGDCPGIGLIGSAGSVNVVYGTGYNRIDCDPDVVQIFDGFKVSASTSCVEFDDFIGIKNVGDDDPLSETYEFNAGAYVDMMGLRIKITYSNCQAEVHVPERDCTYEAVYRNPWPWKRDDKNEMYLAEIIDHPPYKRPPKWICVGALAGSST